MIQVAPAITRVVDQLLELELITKTQSDEDRRVFTIEITTAGMRLLRSSINQCSICMQVCFRESPNPI